MNHVHFIGAGPGDPEYLTLQGAKLLAGAPTVFAPTPYETTFAGLLAGKTVLVPFDYCFADLVELIEERIRLGDIAFLVPGDLTFYSPFQAVIDHLGELATVIPGVGIANAASARLKKTLDLPGVCNRAVLASPRTLGDDPDSPTLAQLAAPGTTLLIYMNNLPLSELVAELRRGYGRTVPIAILHRLGLPGETVVTGTLDDIESKVGDRDFFELTGEKKRPALTLVIAGETLQSVADSAWWDWRRENIWKHREE